MAQDEPVLDVEQTPTAAQVDAGQNPGRPESNGGAEGAGQDAGPATEDTGADTETSQPAQTSQPQPDWNDKENARLKRSRDRAQQERDAALAEIQRLRQGQPDPGADFERRVNEAAQVRAAQLAAQQDFDRQCAEAQAAGRAANPDFDARVSSLKNIVDFNDPERSAAYNQFLQTALATGEGARIIYELGGNQEEAQRILGLPPVQMAIELTKMSARPPAESVSGAPRPIVPVGRGTTHRSPIDPSDPGKSDDLSTAEWMRRREEQAAEQRRARAGRY